MDLTASELCDLNVFAIVTLKLLLRAFEARAFDWTIQEGEEAGQTVSHLHLHLIPRKPKDLAGPGDWSLLLRGNGADVANGETRPRLSPQEMRETVDALRTAAGPRDPSVDGIK
jgi:bis(5'-adenosyl)-triphosphatase